MRHIINLDKDDMQFLKDGYPITVRFNDGVRVEINPPKKAADFYTDKVIENLENKL